MTEIVRLRKAKLYKHSFFLTDSDSILDLFDIFYN